MSVSNENNKVAYTSDGIATTYTIPFYFTDNSHVDYYVDGVKKVYLTDYSVTGEGISTGGTLTIIGTVPVSGAILTALRKIPIKQESTFTNGGPMPSTTIESMFDKTALIDQQIDEKATRAIKFPVHSSINPEIDQDNIVGDAILAFNATATGLIAGPSYVVLQNGIASVSTSEANAAASAAAAATSETNAATSATNAANSATSAANSATSASTSATNASNSATSASTSATNAATSETNAATSATNAANSASSASTSATNAATSATNAANSASAAATSETNAANSATSAANSSATMLAGTANIGDPAVDGSWRIAISGADLLIQKRILSVWTTISEFNS